MERKAYPSDVSDAEWALVVPYLTLSAFTVPLLPNTRVLAAMTTLGL